MLAGLLIAPIIAVRGVAQRSGGAAAAELIAQALARQPGAPVHRLFAELEGRPTALIKVPLSRCSSFSQVLNEKSSEFQESLRERIIVLISHVGSRSAFKITPYFLGL